MTPLDHEVVRALRREVESAETHVEHLRKRNLAEQVRELEALCARTTALRQALDELAPLEGRAITARAKARGELRALLTSLGCNLTEHWSRLGKQVKVACGVE